MYIYYRGQQDNRRIEVSADEDSESPRSWGRFSHMVCAHNRYTLGDEQAQYINLYGNWGDWFEHEVVAKDGTWELPDDLPENDDYTDEEYDEAYEQYRIGLVNEHMNDIAFLPLHLYDHSGISMSWTDKTYPFCDKWDSGPVGWIYVWKEDWLKNGGQEENWKELALNMLKTEVGEYNQWLEGDVFCITAFEDDEGVDSICGVYANDRKELEDAAVDFFGDDWRMELEDQ